MSEWLTAEKAQEYLGKADSIPHRQEGEEALLEFLSPDMKRVLDLGCGAGRLGRLVLRELPEAELVGLDLSPDMLAKGQEAFGVDGRVHLVRHDLNDALPDIGRFDAVVSSFAFHYVPHPRKRSLAEEIYEALNEGGVFLNLDRVASPTPELHQAFVERVGPGAGAKKELLDVRTQLDWLRELGFGQVDCHWKWRELALIGAKREGAG